MTNDLDGITYAPDYTHVLGDRPGTPLNVPFVRPNGELTEVPCIHATANVMITTNDFDDHQPRAVWATWRKGEAVGTYCQFSAEECRKIAQAWLGMADYIDEENKK